MAAHKLHVDKTFGEYPTAFLKQYRAEIHRDVTSNDGHVYFSRPTQKWILVRSRNKKFELGFYDECPCNLM
jgi:hypothetical protein